MAFRFSCGWIDRLCTFDGHFISLTIYYHFLNPLLDRLRLFFFSGMFGKGDFEHEMFVYPSGDVPVVVADEHAGDVGIGTSRCRSGGMGDLVFEFELFGA